MRTLSVVDHEFVFLQTRMNFRARVLLKTADEMEDLNPASIDTGVGTLENEMAMGIQHYIIKNPVSGAQHNVSVDQIVQNFPNINLRDYYVCTECEVNYIEGPGFTEAEAAAERQRLSTD